MVGRWLSEGNAHRKEQEKKTILIQREKAILEANEAEELGLYYIERHIRENGRRPNIVSDGKDRHNFLRWKKSWEDNQ